MSASSRRRVAELLRALGHEVVGADAGDEVFAALAQALEPLRERLARCGRRPARVYQPEADGSGMTLHPDAQEFGSLSGPSNPLAPPIQAWIEGEVARAEVTFGRAHQGHPGFVHGGYVAAGFDELFGMTQRLVGEGPVVTGTLSVRYRNPVPLDTRLCFEGRVRTQRGRKILLEATLRAGDTLLADAEALFLRVDPERYRALLASNGSG